MRKKYMKNFIKTTALALLGIALFTTPTFATSEFNNPGEMPTITVANSTRVVCNYGPIDGCWKTSTTAQAGDVIAVSIYYKNTSNTVSQGTTLGLKPQSSGPTTSITFSGGVASLTGPRAVGSASVSISSSQSLTYIPGSGKWYPSATSGTREIDSSALFGTSGFNIGTVNPGEQGALVAFFKVSNNVTTEQCVIDNFYASPTSVPSGGSSTLYWNTTGCDNVSIDGNNQSLDGSTSTGSLYSSRNYEIRATKGNSIQTRNAYVTVNQINNPTCDISFYSNTTSVISGNPVILSWNTNGLSSVSIYPTLGSQNSSGSATVYPTSSTTYTLSGYGCGNSYNRTVTINVNSIVQNTRPQAITTVATILGSTSARLNGIAVPNSTYNTTSWFQWGTNSSLNFRTNAQAVNSNSSTYYSEPISGLVPGGVYYYRAVVQNQNGIAYGDIVRFQTQKTTVVVNPPTKVITKVITQKDVVVAKSTASLLELRVENVYDRMCVGGEMDYTVSYKNISSQTLQNAVLRITHPKELTFINSSRGDYEVVDRTVTIALGDIPAGGAGTVQVRARVNTNAVIGNLAVTTATVVYTNTITRAQEDAIAYSLITVSNDCPSNLGANAFGIASFFPTTLLGWLILILVILALIVLGRQIYKKKE